MKKIYLAFAIVPALVLGVVTVLRAWLEVHSPDGSATRLVSANVLSLVWTVCVPALLLRKGISLWQMLLVGLIFFLGVRLVVGAVYALAWSDKWTVDGTGDPVRYVAQIQETSPDASALQVFLSNAFPPVPFGLVILFVVWSITWAVGFRGKRPFARGAQGEPAMQAQ